MTTLKPARQTVQTAGYSARRQGTEARNMVEHASDVGGPAGTHMQDETRQGAAKHDHADSTRRREAPSPAPPVRRLLLLALPVATRFLTRALLLAASIAER